MGGLIAGASLVAYVLGDHWGGTGHATSLTFAALVGGQLTSSLVFRSEHRAFFQLEPNRWLALAIAGSLLTRIAVFLVPLLRDIFDLSKLSARDAGAVFALSMAPLLLGEVAKLSGIVHRLGWVPQES
jgi:hypothetical protein